MLQTTTEDNIIIVTISHNRHNTIDWEILTSLNKLVAEIEQNAAIKGMIITGSGNYFSCGFHIPMLLDLVSYDDVLRFLGYADGALVNVFSCKKPIIACLNGSAIAAGLILAMCCDYRISTDDPKAKYGLSEIKLGLSISLVHTEILRFGMNIHDLRNMASFGTLLDCNQAKELRIIDEIVADPVIRAKEIINDWMGNPGDPFTHIKETIRYAIVKKIHKRLEEETGKENLNIIHNPQTRKALEEISKKMG